MDDIVEKNIYYREKRPFYIYIHTCPNHWTYVGLSQQPKQRWNNGEGYKDNKRFYEAIKKFGWGNIKHEIVAETNYRWIARKIERTIITHFQKKEISFNENNIETVLLEKKGVRKVPLKKVAQYDKDGNLIRVYDSANQVGKDLKVSSIYIQDCCRGTRKTAYKYIWKYI